MQRTQEQTRLLEQEDVAARLRATIEEELGSFQHCADATSAKIEGMASRLVNAISPFLGLEERVTESRAA